MPTDLELAARVRAAERAADAMKQLTERLEYRQSLLPTQIPDRGMERVGAAQTDLENAQRGVELALEGMASAGCDDESIAEAKSAVEKAAPVVLDLRARMEDLRPKPATEPGVP
jgi:hypothetical protein